MKKAFSKNLTGAFCVLLISSICFTGAGCRRTDVRDFEVSIPALTVEKEEIVRNAIARFSGIDKSSIRFDQKSKKLFLKYDSMQLAKKNIELAIAKAGLSANGVAPESVAAR